MTVNGVTTDYEYNALDQLTNIVSVVYDYDERGNLSTITNGSNITTYTYDAADRLTNVTAPGVTASYGYDADGRRVTQSFNGQVTNSLWDEASPYGDVVLETNAIGSPLASYVLGGTGLISQTRSGNTNYYLQDGQNSPRALTNGSGTVTDTYSYTAFGELFNQTGSTTNSYLYTGQQFDSLTGLYSLRARYYNPALGRFLSQDTYPYNFSNPVELNRYVYTANDPVNMIDPTGLEGLVAFAFRSPQSVNIGNTYLPAIAVYISAVVVAYLVLLDQVVQAPPHSITWQELYKNVRSSNPGPGRGFDWRKVITTAISILTIVSLVANPNAIQDTVELSPDQTDDDTDQWARVRHYSYRIKYNMTNLTIGSPDSASIWVEYPILTAYNEKAVRETVTFFGRNPDLVNGFVEFNVDLSRWQLLPDDMLPGSNSRMIPLVTLDGDFSYLGRGFPLYEPGVDPRFFDKTGRPIG